MRNGWRLKADAATLTPPPCDDDASAIERDINALIAQVLRIKKPEQIAAFLEWVKKKGFKRHNWIYADQGYTGDLATKVFWLFDYLLRVVKRREGAVGFELLPKRWIVERTFAWLGKHRLLSKDYELRPDTSDANVYIAMTALMLNRLKSVK